MHFVRQSESLRKSHGRSGAWLRSWIWPMAAFCAAGTGSDAFAAGFEKVATWSGRYAGLGGAGVSAVTGSESLFFNPAGLAAGQGTMDMSANLSSTFAQFNGPIYASGQSFESARKFSPVFGVVFRRNLGEGFGIGAGIYASGGSKAVFEGVDFSSASPHLDTLKPNIKSDLSLVEAALGAGYEFMPGLRLGLAWRLMMVRASLGTAGLVGSGATSSLLAVESDDLTATRFNGFKAGLQYAPQDSGWGLGASVRTEVGFTAKGTSSGKIESAASAGNAADVTGGEMTASAVFPLQVTLGGFYEPMKDLRILGEYAWTQYSKNQSLTLGGNVTIPGLGTSPLSSIQMNWQNQTNLRIGAEWMAFEDWAVRAAYAYTSQVVPQGSARATFSSPGAGNTFTLGTGTWLADRTVDLNLAFEFSQASGNVESAITGGGGTIYAGDYKSDVFVAHAGIGYYF